MGTSALMKICPALPSQTAEQGTEALGKEKEQENEE